MRPRNLCRHRLHKCFIRISLCEFCHVFEVAHRIPFDIRERNADIGGKILYEFTPPCLVFVYHFAYMVIEHNQLTVHIKCRLILRSFDLTFYRFYDLQMLDIMICIAIINVISAPK